MLLDHVYLELWIQKLFQGTAERKGCLCFAWKQIDLHHSLVISNGDAIAPGWIPATLLFGGWPQTHWPVFLRSGCTFCLAEIFCKISLNCRIVFPSAVCFLDDSSTLSWYLVHLFFCRLAHVTLMPWEAILTILSIAFWEYWCPRKIWFAQAMWKGDELCAC